MNCWKIKMIYKPLGLKVGDLVKISQTCTLDRYKNMYAKVVQINLTQELSVKVKLLFVPVWLWLKPNQLNKVEE